MFVWTRSDIEMNQRTENSLRLFQQKIPFLAYQIFFTSSSPKHWLTRSSSKWVIIAWESFYSHLLLLIHNWGGGLIGLTKYLEIAKNRLIFFKKRWNISASLTNDVEIRFKQPMLTSKTWRHYQHQLWRVFGRHYQSAISFTNVTINDVKMAL